MRKKICFVVTIPGAARNFLRDHIAVLQQFYDVYIVSNILNSSQIEMLDISGWKSLPIQRGISIKSDLKNIKELTRYFKEMQFDAVHSMTPKAGFLTAVAAKRAKIQHRTHIFTGQVWANMKGISRFLLKKIDKKISQLDNHILVDGKSQMRFLEKEKILKPGKGIVFANGSISGVNSERFIPNLLIRKELRHNLGIAEGTIVFTFLGRLNKEKGIHELLVAFNDVAKEHSNVFLLLIGPDEHQCLKDINSYEYIKNGKNFHYYGKTTEPEKVLNAGDVFVLPTYREGFGSSVLEAACIGLPAICSDAYGVQDAFVEGVTGLKCKIGDSNSLYLCMKHFLQNPDLIKEMGQNARERALRDFNGKDISKLWLEFYKDLLK